MKAKVLWSMIFILVLSVYLPAQDYDNMRQFHDAEWRMKVALHQKLENNLASDIILDMADYDVKYWNLELDVTDIAGQTITGKVTMTSQAVVDGVTNVEYNFLDNMDVDSVKAGGQTVSFSHSNDILNITMDRTYDEGEYFTTIVYYNGQPQASGFGSFTWDSHNGQPLVTSLSEPEGARDWWPCKDEPHDKADTSDIYITVPDNLVATSNGVLVSNIDNGDGTRTFHWHNHYPITTYLVCASISNYQDFTDWYVTADNDSMPVTNYVFPDLYNQAVIDLSITPSAIAFYASKFGEYPFIEEKYGHTLFPWGGAMEHQCNTSYGYMLIRGDHAYDYILVHELSHMWFGDMITTDTWPNIWMNEGFASYCEALWAENLGGFSAYRSYMNSSNYVTDPSGPIYDPEVLFSGNTVYNKGSWVLHMLRGVMGDSAFFEGMYAYANDPRYMYGTITTEEFRDVMEQYYGADLNWYFDEWVWGMNRPFYRYSWMTEDIGNGQYEVFLHIDQAQNSPAPEVFTMPIKMYPRINGQDTVITVFDNARNDDFRFVVNGQPTVMQLDKYDWILKMASQASYGMNIVTTELPDGVNGEAYDVTVEARGGTAPYTFTVVSGDLPPGLELNSETGVISGDPTTNGEYTFTLRCTDSANPQHTDDQEYTMQVANQVGIDDEVTTLPKAFELIGNYPNPFNSTTVVSFRLAGSEYVTVDIYNVLGQEVVNLYSGQLSAGTHTFPWHADKVPSGVYFYRITAGNDSAVQKMTLMK